MAYDTDKLYKKAIEVIKEKELYFMADVYAYLGVSAPTFYEHFPVESKELKDLKDLIESNKVSTKVSIRSKLHQSKSPTGLLALYKLISTDEERKNLSMEYREHSGEMELPKLQVEIVEPDES